jgi:uncharacterized tellurite resistance protein B-like protein
MVMEGLLKWFRGEMPGPATGHEPSRRHQIAAVALLLEASKVDRKVTAEEQKTIWHLVRTNFAEDEAATRRLIELADGAYADALDDQVFARAVREGFDHAQCIEIVKLLWEVVYADGELAPPEEDLMQHLAEGLCISVNELDQARAEVYARMGRLSGAES